MEFQVQTDWWVKGTIQAPSPHPPSTSSSIYPPTRPPFHLLSIIHPATHSATHPPPPETFPSPRACGHFSEGLADPWGHETLGGAAWLSPVSDVTEKAFLLRTSKPRPRAMALTVSPGRAPQPAFPSTHGLMFNPRERFQVLMTRH